GAQGCWRNAPSKLQEAGFGSGWRAVWRAGEALATVVCAARRGAGAARGRDAYL
ncbi:hypothetical protein A2U01_0114291, partial [Trifolium medium]|nr:hypothetical protein [Trifolium medium]